MTDYNGSDVYFPYDIQISSHHWSSLELGELSRTIGERSIPRIIFFRQMAARLNAQRISGAAPVHASELNLYASLQRAFRYLIDAAADYSGSYVLTRALKKGGLDPAGEELKQTASRFVDLFPPEAVLQGKTDGVSWLSDQNHAEQRSRHLLREMLLLSLAADNPAVESFRELVDDRSLAASSHYRTVIKTLDRSLKKGPPLEGLGHTLIDALKAAIAASPASLAGQVGYLRRQWHDLLPPELIQEVDTAFDILVEEQRERGWGNGDPGPSPVLEFSRADGRHGRSTGPERGSSVFEGFDYPEYEQFSTDADWMSNVVLLAKMVYVWLDQLSSSYRYPITRLDQIPDAELDQLAARGFSGLWLIGLWERSPASQRIKQICGNPDAIASAYSLYDYEVAADLGGWEGLANLRERAGLRGIRLASDMVPNHTGIYSRWVIQHPDWFVQTDYPPFPTYQFTGEDLSHDPHICIQVEDGYWSKSDASVVFKLYDRRDGRTRYIYHGNDGTSIPWNDTAQLNYLIPELREAVIQTILHVARNFPIIRFDAAMTLAKKHYQRLWYPLRGLGGGIPSRAEHGMSQDEFNDVFPVEFWREVVDRVAAEAPGTLLLAEAFWMMEGYFVRTLGMHRVYNSAFMNMLKTEENAKYRLTIRNVLEFNHEILKRFVNFMNNPDEKTAVAQFGSQGKYFGACVLLSTMPGLPMFGHGQVEGFHEKYGMEYKRAYWDEQVDEGLLRGHEMWIFPLLRKRWLFSGSENFTLYDFHAGEHVDENVFAYSNRCREQRALVLYNNRHATTAGWINESVSYSVSYGDGEQELRRTTLCQALGIHDKENVFVIFRDLTEGLEYLRSACEMFKRGLYVELGEYQFHVFLDFREISDDGDNSWRKLFLHLEGAGVDSLEDHRKQLLFEKLNVIFSEILLRLTVDDASTIRFEITSEMIDAFHAEAAALAVSPGTPDTLFAVDDGVSSHAALPTAEDSAALETSLKMVAQLRALKTKVRDAVLFQKRLTDRFSDQGAVGLLLSWFLLRTTTIDPLKCGLDYTLRLWLQGSDHDFSLRLIPLLSALIEATTSHRLRLKSSCDALDSLIIRVVSELPDCRSFLLTHESDGTEWFNKERFEELCEWLQLCHLLETVTDSSTPRIRSISMSAAEATLQKYFSLASAAGYRSVLFVELIAAAAGTSGRAGKIHSKSRVHS